MGVIATPRQRGVWTTLGDRTLIEVTAETLYGPTRPSALENMPYDGYSVLPVAVALNTVIIPILYSWTTLILNRFGPPYMNGRLDATVPAYISRKNRFLRPRKGFSK